ncbi:MAG: hypothetical protein HYS17_11640 [Micavibrio aeruginosavorus]|uniref:Uncharacterized protein n=1 Tax=Micavibrio aeruginosavorus TaxID=349221 RepID=A0A7T5UHY7_9BACT|nr:MAG: hypothetical protein HYS17_11640 [Micavibrio aeruginosavorus]
MPEITGVSADSVQVSQRKARTFSFGADGRLAGVAETPRTRTLGSEDVARLGQVREAHNPGSHEIFAQAGAAMRTAQLHAAGQALTDAPRPASPAATPKPGFKPEKPGS